MSKLNGCQTNFPVPRPFCKASAIYLRRLFFYTMTYGYSRRMGQFVMTFTTFFSFFWVLSPLPFVLFFLCFWDLPCSFFSTVDKIADKILFLFLRRWMGKSEIKQGFFFYGFLSLLLFFFASLHFFRPCCVFLTVIERNWGSFFWVSGGNKRFIEVGNIATESSSLLYSII